MSLTNKINLNQILNTLLYFKKILLYSFEKKI